MTSDPNPFLAALAAVANAAPGFPWAEAAVRVWRLAVPGVLHVAILGSRRDPMVKEVEAYNPERGWETTANLFLQQFRRQTGRTHPFVHHVFRETRPALYVRSRLVDERTWHKTEHFKTIDQPLGVYDMVAAYIPLLDGNYIVLCAGTAGLIREPAETWAFLPQLLFRLSPTINATGAETTTRRELLSIRECQVMYWVAEGKRNAEIASILGLSPHTVRAHLEHIFDKLDVSTRGAAVRRWRQGA